MYSVGFIIILMVTSLLESLLGWNFSHALFLCCVSSYVCLFLRFLPYYLAVSLHFKWHIALLDVTLLKS